MTALSAVVSNTRNDYLRAGTPEHRNKVSGALLDSDTTFTFTYDLGTLQAGSKISAGLEDIHVWSVDTSLKTADVDRGEYNTTAAALSDGDTVLVNPRYTDSQIMRALNAATSQLASEGVYQVSSVEVTKSTAVDGYDITSSADFLGIIDVVWENTVTSSKQWHRVEHYRVLIDANTSDFASGTAVLIDDDIPAGATIRIMYRHELTASLSALTDVVETVTGLETDAMDLLSIGAALHLTAGKEIDRNETDAQRPRRNTDTPAGSWSQADSNLRTIYRDRLRAERSRMAKKYPMRLR